MRCMSFGNAVASAVRLLTVTFIVTASIEAHAQGAGELARRQGSMSLQDFNRRNLGVEFIVENIGTRRATLSAFAGGRKVILTREVRYTRYGAQVRAAWDGFGTAHVAFHLETGSGASYVGYANVSANGAYQSGTSVNGNRTNETPAITTYPNGVAVFWKGRTNNNSYWAWRPYFSTTWQGGEVPSAANRYGPDGACPRGGHYVYLWRGRRNPKNHYYSIYDGQRWGPVIQTSSTVWGQQCPEKTQPGGNLARGAAVSAQSTFPGYAASRITDGSTNTTVGGPYSWANAHTSGANGRLPNWVDITLSQARSFNEIRVYTSQGYEIRDFDLQVLGGSGWATVAVVRNNTQVTRTLRFGTVTSNKIRVIARRGPANQSIYARINELQVYRR